MLLHITSISMQVLFIQLSFECLFISFFFLSFKNRLAVVVHHSYSYNQLAAVPASLDGIDLPFLKEYVGSAERPPIFSLALFTVPGGTGHLLV